MLDIGFADDVEKILSDAPVERQTMLFSATMPSWVKKLTRKHQRDPLTVDLVGDEEAGKMAESIRWAFASWSLCMTIQLLSCGLLTQTPAARPWHAVLTPCFRFAGC